jgi:threonine dehydrogenase-like Zn-dependent dehydrogenase
LDAPNLGKAVLQYSGIEFAAKIHDVDVVAALKDMTDGRGSDACIDTVGMEADGTTGDAIYDQVKHVMWLKTDCPHALRVAIQVCRKGRTVSVIGVFGGLIDKVPFGAAFAKGLTCRMGQVHVDKYLRRLLEYIESKVINPAFVITHRLSLEDAPHGYELFRRE